MLPSTSAPRVAVILVNWNGKADTLAGLESLAEDNYPNKAVILVDNGSTDDSVAVVRAAFPEVTVLETGANLGFTGGNNVGIRHALEEGVDYIYLLNNDTAVEPDSVQQLVGAAEAHPAFGLFTPVIYYYDHPEEAWFCGSQMDLRRGAAVHDNSRLPGVHEAPFGIPWASGCAMLFRAGHLRTLRGFDERFFIFWEDVDLCLRLRALGTAIALVPAARIYHKVSRSPIASSSVGRYYYVRNNLLIVKTHGGNLYPQAALRIIFDRLRESIRAIRHRRASPADSLHITLRAILDHFLQRYGKAAL